MTETTTTEVPPTPQTALEKRVMLIVNAAINEHNELSVASYGELVHRVVKLVEEFSAPQPAPDAGEWRVTARNSATNLAVIRRMADNALVGRIQMEHADRVVLDHNAVPKLAAALEDLKCRAEFALSTPGLIKGRDELKRAVIVTGEALALVKGQQQ